MAYTIILPFLLTWIVFSVIVLILVRCLARGWSGRAYLFHVFVWSSIGVIAANLSFLASFGFFFDFISRASQHRGFNDFLAPLVLGSTAIFGPLVVSFIGWLFGIWLGLVVAYLRDRHTKA
jgi:hypothetical protein